jgi:hypothetical protein
MTTEELASLASERSPICVSISFNTHRTRPDNAADPIRLKNLVKSAEEKILNEYDKRSASVVLEKLSQLSDSIDPNYNLDSLHIFISEHSTHIERSPWPTSHERVHISDRFHVKHLIKNWNNTEDYYILLLSQSGVQLYHAMNDSIQTEVREEGFPFAQNQHYITDADQMSDSKQGDNLLREYFNKVDKALVRAHHQTGWQCVVICTPENFGFLMQVADKPSVYYGFSPINYNDLAPHVLSQQAWQVVLNKQVQRRVDAIDEMQAAVGQGKVITDLGEIFRAVQEGRGDLLIAHDSFEQPARIMENNQIELLNNTNENGAIEDITSDIAWSVIAKKGRAIFTSQDDIKKIGSIALKVRY